MTTTKNPDEEDGRDTALVAAAAAGALGLILTLGALSIYGSRTALSVAVGAAIAIANLVTMRAIIRSILQEPEGADAAPSADAGADGEPKDEPPPARDHVAEGKRGGTAWGAFALIKILVLFGGIWILLTRGMVDPIPLVVGYGVLPLGIAASSLLTSLSPRRRRRPR
jgi:hypothetical protein